jgi:hypothetical protein
LIDIIHNLRDEDDEDLQIQCDVFEDEKHEDDEELAEHTPEGIDITDHQKLFTAVFQKVCNTIYTTNATIEQIRTGKSERGERTQGECAIRENGPIP